MLCIHTSRLRTHEVACMRRLQHALAGCRFSHLEADVAAAMAAVVARRRVSSATATTLIDFYSRTRAWYLGVAAFKGLHRVDAVRCRTCAHAALRACIHGRDAATAWEVYKLMKHPYMHPDSETFELVIPLIADSGDWSSCLQVRAPPPPDQVSMLGADGGVGSSVPPQLPAGRPDFRVPPAVARLNNKFVVLRPGVRETDSPATGALPASRRRTMHSHTCPVVLGNLMEQYYVLFI